MRSRPGKLFLIAFANLAKSTSRWASCSPSPLSRTSVVRTCSWSFDFLLHGSQAGNSYPSGQTLPSKKDRAGRAHDRWTQASPRRKKCTEVDDREDRGLCASSNPVWHSFAHPQKDGFPRDGVDTIARFQPLELHARPW